MGATASNAADKGRKTTPANRPQYDTVASVSDLQKISWVQVPDGVVTDCIAWVCAAGDAISFSAGAQSRWLGVTLLTDGGTYKKQFHSIGEAVEGLNAICDTARKRAS